VGEAHFIVFCLILQYQSLNLGYCIDNIETTYYNITKRREYIIMAQTTVSVRMDNDLKKEFDSVCNDLGLSMTTAITMLAKKMTREKRLPFEVSIDPFYSDENMKRLKESIAQMEAIGGTVHEVDLND
jgi:DNA-damage-inducible protein J